MGVSVLKAVTIVTVQHFECVIKTNDTKEKEQLQRDRARDRQEFWLNKPCIP